MKLKPTKDDQDLAELQALLKEADELGIVNIDVNAGVDREGLRSSIAATRRLNNYIDRDEIGRKLDEVRRTLARGRK